MLEQFYAKSNAVKYALAISVLAHILLVSVSTLSKMEKAIDLTNYRAVQLMNIEQEVAEAVPSPEVVEESEVKKAAPVKTTFQKESFSNYLPFFKVARLPKFKEKISPVYPHQEKLLAKESEVLSEVYIDERGRVRKVVIIRSGGENFDKAIIEALYAAEFTPAISRDGKPVSVRVRIPFKFELD
jgi:TonB family protein